MRIVENRILSRRCTYRRGIRLFLRKAAGRVHILGVARRVRAGTLNALAAFSRYEPPDDLPLPPARLRTLVNGTPDGRVFFDAGVFSAEAIRNAVRQTGADLSQMGAILDFGCGCGRTLRHWHEAGVRVVGVDVNPDLVEWCRDNLTFADCVVSKPLPPVPFAPTSFGLVYSVSVFTHLTVERQQLWLHEMSRILAPGGLLVVSTHGDRLAAGALDRARLQAYAAGEIVVVEPEAEGSNVCAVFHPAGSMARLAEGTGLTHVLHTPEALVTHDIHVLRRDTS